MSDNENKSKAIRRGVIALVILAVLTVAEYFIAAGMNGAFTPLAAAAMLKTVLIMQIFMNIGRLAMTEGGDH